VFVGKDARTAERLTGLPVQVIRFEDLAFGPEFEGVWASASLLHVPRADLSTVLDRLASALKPGGVLFASVKRGEGEGVRDGRWFTFYTPAGLRRELEDQPELNVYGLWETPDVWRGRAGVTWVNALAVKHPR
jgi:hypothetical protein